MEQLDEISANVDLEKLDDINHTFKVVYKLFKQAYDNVPKDVRRGCGLVKETAEHVYRGLQIGIIANPDTYSRKQVTQLMDHYWSGDNHTACPSEWCPKKKNPEYCPAINGGSYFDKEGNEVHKITYKEIMSLVNEYFTEERLKRLHGIPRTNDNEMAHSITSKRFSKATRPPKVEVAQGIVASVAGTWNWGRGMWMFHLCKSLGFVSNQHKLKFNQIQSRVMYNWHRSRSDEYKIKQAVKTKKFTDRQQKRKKNRDKLSYKKNTDKPTTKKRPRASNKPAAEPKSKKQKTTKGPAYICARCKKGYTYRASYDKHVKDDFKICKEKKPVV